MKVTIEIEVEPNKLNSLVDVINGVVQYNNGPRNITVRPAFEDGWNSPAPIQDKVISTGDGPFDTAMDRKPVPPKPPSKRRQTTDKQAKEIAYDLSVCDSPIESIARTYDKTPKVIKDIATGKSFLRITGFEPLENREEDNELDPKYYNRTPTGRLNARAKELIEFYSAMYEEGKRRTVKARLAKMKKA